MDATRFDAWTRALPALGTRRAALRVLTGGGVAGIALLGHRDHAAACRKAGKECEKDKQCCSKMCKGKKCRCTKLKGACPGFGTGFRCCPKPGASVDCSFAENGFKPQCGPNGFRCLLAANDPCSDDCECGADLECEGSSAARCCFRLGHDCDEGPGESLCCSEQCGCTAPGSCTCRFANCANPGASCSLHTQCCDGVCSSGECCLPQGIPCSTTAQCCGALFCDTGFCDTP